jgi:hypothetical protein
MSHVFISYARSTAKEAQAVATALRGLGHEVWLDDEMRQAAPFAGPRPPTPFRRYDGGGWGGGGSMTGDAAIGAVGGSAVAVAGGAVTEAGAGGAVTEAAGATGL